MNKSDFKLIIILFVIVGIIFIIISIIKKDGTVVEVYYDNNLILSKDLNIDGEYTVDGLLGEVVIEVKDRKVRIKKENSPKNICSKEGYITDSSKPLICLPNKIVVKIVNNNEIDGVVY